MYLTFLKYSISSIKLYLEYFLVYFYLNVLNENFVLFVHQLLCFLFNLYEDDYTKCLHVVYLYVTVCNKCNFNKLVVDLLNVHLQS